ncbi:MAG TPA: hypothetical protein VKQ32_30220 [Polyangia bacterium]|nr:hypothetical protein [Polyangia bacterium]
MQKRHGLAPLLFLLIASGAACDDGGPADPGPAPADLRVDGNYEIVSTYDFTAGSVLPEPMASYAQAIVGLRKDPAGTMFQLLDDAGVPLASDLMDALPGPVADQLKKEINDFFASQVYGNASASSELDSLTAVIETVVARPEVVSQLSLVAPDASGATVATHRLEGLRYHLDGGALVITAPFVPSGAESSVLTLETTASGRATGALAGEDAHLQVGDHAFGVAYGDAVLSAIDQAARAGYGTDLRGALGTLVDCDAMAASVAGKCVLGACIGHQSTLVSICNSGVDLAVQQLTDRVRALHFDALRQSGDAQMWDAATAGGATDRRVDRLAAGHWAASIDFGMGPRNVTASFSGTRAPGP